MNKFFPVFLLLCSLALPSFAEPPTSAWDALCEAEKNLSPSFYFQNGMEAMQKGEYKKAAGFFVKVTANFPEFSNNQEAYFQLGYAYYRMGELALANEAFSSHLGLTNSSSRFEQVIDYKFAIAERFKNGEKKRLFEHARLPRCISGESSALDIYDEIIAAVPSHELAVRSLYSKACVLWRFWLHRESIEASQTLIKRFPKHELVPSAHLLISKVYREQCMYEFQNPDLLALCEMNLKKFRQSYPRDERLERAEEDFRAITETYAKGMFDTAEFYTRKGLEEAAFLYYRNTIEQFPETNVAVVAQEKIGVLQEKCASVIFKDGQFYEYRKDVDRALVYYKEVLDKYPDTNVATYCRQRIDCYEPKPIFESESLS